MDNRFGFKDLIFTVLLVVFILSIWLSMKQADRQGETLRSIDQKLTEHTRELARIRDAVRHGVPAGGAAEQPVESDSDRTDQFDRLRELRQREDFATGDTLMQIFAQAPDRLTPIISTDAYASIIQDYVLESLAGRNGDTLEWEPVIARDWEIIENTDQWQAYIDERLGEPVTEEQVRGEDEFAELGDDEAAQQAYIERRLEEGRRMQDIVRDEEAPVALTIRFDLRRNVEFSDGEPLSADDVVFSFDWIMNPEVEAVRQRVYYSPIRAVEKIDDHTVAFHFREPYFRAFDFAAGMQIMPEHFYGRYSPSEFNRHPALLLGSGPYRLPSPVATRPQPGVPIELVRNERYWAGADAQPAFDRLVWRVVEQDSSREQAFLNREVDAFPATPEQYDRLKENDRVAERSQRFEFLRPTSGYNYIAWNQVRRGEPTPFADKRVRQAMTMLLDRERLAEDVYRGYAQVISGSFNPLGQQVNPDVEPWPYDVAAARQLLAEAGYQDRSGDGVLQGPDGQPFRFTLNFPAGSDTYQQMAMFARDSYQRAGIEVDARPLEWQVLLERIKSTRDYDAVALGWTGNLESDPYQIFHSSMIPPPGDNATSYANRELDALIEKARMTPDEEARMAMWHEVHRILHDDQPYTFMMAQKSLLFFDDRIRNIERTQTGLTPTLEWYVPAELQKR